ncbi:MAG: DUF364 domain-containing protein [Thermodesulfobacteriota bacterium]
MSILEEAAALVKERLGGGMDDLTVARLVIGLFFTGVKLSNGQAGVCYTPVKEIPSAVCCPSSVGRVFDPTAIPGTGAAPVLAGLDSAEPLKTATAIAVLNALSATCWDRGLTGGYSIKRNLDAQEAVPMPLERSVAVIGAFVPTLRILKRRGGTWWVIEQDPRTLKDDELDHFVPAESSTDIIGRADVLIITGVTLINHTLAGILEAAKPGADIAVMGPTAGFLPEPLFKRGVRVVGGVWVRKADQLLDVLAAGGSGYHFFDTLVDRIVIERV